MSRLSLPLVLLASLAPPLAGCHDLPEVEPDVCGNLVVDETEDCDGFSAFGESTSCAPPGDANECAYVCTVVPDQPEGVLAQDGCPPGWGCGHDGRCRRPSGLFRAAGPPWPMPVDSFAIGDADGDGHADLLGNNQQSLMIRYGSPAADFQDSFEMNIRRPVGPVTYERFDEDTRLDAIIPTQEGLFVLLGDQERTLEPVAYSPFVFEDGEMRFYPADVAATPLTDVLFLVVTEEEGLGAGFLFSSAPPTALPNAPGSTPAHPLTPAIGDVDGDGRAEVIIAHQGATEIHVFEIVGSPGLLGEPSTFALSGPVALPLPGPARVGERLAMADVDGSGQADVLVALEGGLVAVAYAAGGALQAPVAEPLFGTPTARRPFPLAAGDLDGDGTADYVFPDRIAVARQEDGDAPPDRLDPVAFATLGAWSDAIIGDLNADGRPDVAVAVNGDGGATATGLDILVQSEVMLFNRFPVDTRRPPRTSPRTMAVGDLDGDLVDDLAFAEDGRGVEQDAVVVVYGARDGGFRAPVKMGELDRVQQLVAARMATGVSNLDGIADLLALSRDGADSALAILLGDASRRMVSPFFLSENPQAGPGILHVPVRALIGDFDADGVRDVLAVAVAFDADQTPGGEPGPTTARPTAWVLPGEGGGRIDSARVNFTSLGDFQEFNFLCSTWEAVSLAPAAGAGASDIVGVDDGAVCGGFGGEALDAPELLVVSVDAAGGAAPSFDSYHAQLDATLSAPESVTAADIDGDGDLDPIVLFRGEHRARPDDTSPIPGAGVAVLWNDGGTPASSTMSLVEAPDTTRLNGVAALFLDEDEHRDLVLLTDQWIYQVLYDPDAHAFRPAEPLFIDTGLLGAAQQSLLAAGDLNGDGLDDVAVVQGSSVTVLLAEPAPPLGARYDVLLPDQGSGSGSGGGSGEGP